MKQTKRILAAVLSVLTLAGCLSGCGSTGGGDGDAVKVALLCSGPINDGGFNTDAYDAVMRYEEDYGWKVAYTENVAQADIVTTMREYAKNGYQFIVGNGYEFGDPMLSLAEEYPDVYFFDIIGGVSNGKNVGSGTFLFGELGYLCGLLAARTTQSGKIGFIGPMEIPTIVTEMTAMEMTVADELPDASFTSVFTGSWTDVAKAKESALSMINAGCDVIISNCDACDPAIIQACEENGVKYIGFASDKNKISPDTVLTSAVQSTPKLLELVGKAYAEGKPVVDVHTYDVASGACYLATWSEKADPAVKEEILKAESDIKSGALELDLSRYAAD